MDARSVVRVFALILVSSVVGCGSLPSQDFSFSLDANNPTSSGWFQKGLASSGSLRFRFRLHEPSQGAADVKFKLGSFASEQAMTIRISDERCAGAYLVSVQYSVGAREWRSIYLKPRLLWDQEAEILLAWDASNRVLIAINDSESQVISLSHGIHNIRVDVSKGAIDVIDLDYLVSR